MDAGSPPVIVYDRIASNRRRTWAFLLLATVASLPSLAYWLPYAAFVVFVFSLPLVAGLGLGDESTVALAALMAVLAVALVPVLVYRGARAVTTRVIGAVPLGQGDGIWLRRAAENMAIAAGIAPPALYVIESPAANLLSLGLGPDHASIVATRGLIDLLEPDETDAVVAHEVAHIMSGDTRLGTVIAAQVALLQLPWRTVRAAVVGGLRLATRVHPFLAIGCGLYLLAMAASLLAAGAALVDEGGALAVVQLAGLALLAYTLAGAPLAVQALGRAAWREHEHMADAGAFLLTRRPDSLARALARLEAAEGHDLPTVAVSHLWIVPALPGARSHPDTAERIARVAAMGGGPPSAVIAEAERAAGGHLGPGRAGGPAVES